MTNSTGERCDPRTVTRFYDFNGNVTAFCVSISRAGKPSGYVLISLLAEKDPIVEFSFDGIGLVESINKVYGNRYLIRDEKQYVYLGPDLLFVIDENKRSCLDVYTGKENILSDVEKVSDICLGMNSRDDIGGGIMSFWSGSVLASSINMISSFGNPTNYWNISSLDPDGGNTCAPTCATNIVWYWATKRSCSWAQPFSSGTDQDKARSVFAVLKLAMCTSDTLGTMDNMISVGYSDYLEYVCGGDNYSITNVVNNDYSSFVDAIDDNCPIHTSLWPYNSILCDGHDVMTYGYAESTSGTEYLMVMDGWNTDYRILQFSYYTSGTRLIKGRKIWIGTSMYG